MLRRIREMLQCHKGFTIVELLAVIAIIGVLAAIAIPKFSKSSDDAQVAKILSDLRNMDSAIAAYGAANNISDYSTITTSNIASYFQSGSVPTAPWSGTYSIASENIAATTVNSVELPAITKGSAICTIGSNKISSTFTVAQVKAAAGK